MAKKYLIVLDPGHGEGENKSPINSRYREGTRMWEFSNILKSHLERAGFSVMTTRSRLSDNPSLSKRGQLAGSNKADLLLSLHSNAPSSSIDEKGQSYYDPTITGVVTCYSQTDKEWNRSLAQKLADGVGALMGNGVKAVFYNDYPGRPGVDYFGILRCGAQCGCKHAIIIEHGYHTNYADSEWLLNNNNLELLAQVETAIICEYFGVSVPFKKGDVNLDGVVNIADVTALLDILSGSNKDKQNADVNGDGKIDVSDTTALLNILAEAKEEGEEEEKIMIELDLLKNGSKGEQVKTLQILLNGLGHKDPNGNLLVVDGDFGSKTEFAVRLFQKVNHIDVDGKVGQNTWTKLLK